MKQKITWTQVLSVTAVGSTSLLYGLMTGWAAVLPRLQDDTNTSYNLTDQDVATLVSMTSFIGVVPSLLSGVMVEVIGPRRLLLSVITPVLGLWILMAFTPYKSVLFIGRAGVAVCTYLEEAILNPLLAELSPASIRGMAMTGVSIASSLGTLISYILAHLTDFTTATASRVIILLVVVILMCFVPESPYWLVRRGRMEKAKNSLRKLLQSESSVEKELSAIRASPASTQASITDQFVALRRGRNARPLILVLILYVLRELGGRNAILQYSVYIFRRGGVRINPFLCTVLLGSTKLLFSVISAYTIDRTGRRPLLIGSSVVCGLALGLAGIFLHYEVPGTNWFPLLALLVYVACYGLGLGPVLGVYLGELLPSPIRSLAVSVITVSYTLAMFAINLAFLNILSLIGVGLTLILMSCMNLIMCPIVIKFIPESAGVTLHDLEMSFVSKRRSEEEEE